VTQLRADAQRNLNRVLEAAAEAFAEQGADVSVDEIARRAGVGHATVFRRFPTKEALIAAVVLARVRAVREIADAALERDDPGEAFRDFVWEVAELQASDKALFDRVADRCRAVPGVAEECESVNASVGRLVKRAQKAGAVRRDIDGDDVPRLISSAINAALQLPSESPDLWRRYLGIVLDGLRPAGSAAKA
jgi:AcrR family transcriptional regulator